MKVRKIAAFLIAALFFAPTGVEAQTNTYAGNYTGTEILGGTSLPIRVRIQEDGWITITDDDNIRGSAKMKGNSFHIKRASPYQVFKGQVKGNKITGITYGNRTFGDGTFSATKR